MEYVSNYDETKVAVNRLLDIKNKTIFRISKSCLHEAILQSSIELPDFKRCSKSNKLEPNIAAIACKNLVTTYPLIFK